MWMAGGGIKGGVSVGETDELGGAADHRPLPRQEPARHGPAPAGPRSRPPDLLLQRPRPEAGRRRRGRADSSRSLHEPTDLTLFRSLVRTMRLVATLRPVSCDDSLRSRLSVRAALKPVPHRVLGVRQRQGRDRRRQRQGRVGSPLSRTGPRHHASCRTATSCSLRRRDGVGGDSRQEGRLAYTSKPKAGTKAPSRSTPFSASPTA